MNIWQVGLWTLGMWEQNDMRKVLKQSEGFPSIGITSPTVDAPGMDTFNSHMRQVIENTEK
jgi:hypothetical protein